MRVGALILFASLFGCDGDAGESEQMCNADGCLGGAVVRAKVSADQLPPATYDVSVAAAGEVIALGVDVDLDAFECGFDRETGGALVVELGCSLFESSELEIRVGDNGFNSGPDQLEVSVSSGGEPLGSAQLEPEYQHPGGPECDGECRRSFVILPIDAPGANP